MSEISIQPERATSGADAPGAKREADADTALIADAWYIAGTSADFSRTLKDRWILNRNVLFYRKEDGTPVALDNRCAHRSFPLSHGSLEGDNVVCGYHGLTYDPAGVCVRVPSLRIVPANICVASYPVVERHPLVWIWVGRRDKADEALIPQHAPIKMQGSACVSGYFHLQCNYVGLHENLHDLTHFSYLHAQTVGTPEFAAARVEVKVADGQVIAHRKLLNADPPPFWARVMGLEGKRVDRMVESRYASPGLHTALRTIADCNPPAGAQASFHVNMLHFITPETQDSTHYFWFSVRDFAPQSEQVSNTQEQGIAATFQQDKDALEVIAALRKNDPRKDFAEVSFASDRPGLETRRLLHQAAQTPAGDITINQGHTA